MPNAYGPFGGGSPHGKINWSQLQQMTRNFNNGMPAPQIQPYALGGGMPRTYVPGQQPHMPYMPAPMMGGPQTFQSNANLGLGQMQPPMPNMHPAPMPGMNINPGTAPLNQNLGLGRMKMAY